MPSEDKQVYPSNLCATCKQRLDTVKKTNKAPSSTVIAEFEPHDDNVDLCNVCSRETHSRHITDVHMKYFDKVLSSYGFLHLTEETSAYRLYYKLMQSDESLNVNLTLRIHKDYTWSIYAL